MAYLVPEQKAETAYLNQGLREPLDSRERDSRLIQLRMKSVFIVTDNNKLKNIGIIHPLTKFTDASTQLLGRTGYESVDQFTEAILEYIGNDREKTQDRMEIIIIPANDMIGIVFKVIHLDRCKAYLVVQRGAGTRYLVYLTGADARGGCSDRFTLTEANLNIIHQNFLQGAKRMNAYLVKCTQMYRLQQSIEHISSNYNSNFGIPG